MEDYKYKSPKHTIHARLFRSLIGYTFLGVMLECQMNEYYICFCLESDFLPLLLSAAAFLVFLFLLLFLRGII
jgi:hypothetical protein